MALSVTQKKRLQLFRNLKLKVLHLAVSKCIWQMELASIWQTKNISIAKSQTTIVKIKHMAAQTLQAAIIFIPETIVIAEAQVLIWKTKKML